MNIRNINTSYLNSVLSAKNVDYLYHFGLCSTDRELELMSDLKAVVMAGSPLRIERMAKLWTKEHDKKKVFIFPKDERFKAIYTNGVLFSSHGMGMPSMSIALQELMKLVYFVKKGDLKKVENVFWCRVNQWWSC